MIPLEEGRGPGRQLQRNWPLISVSSHSSHFWTGSLCDINPNTTFLFTPNSKTSDGPLHLSFIHLTCLTSGLPSSWAFQMNSQFPRLSTVVSWLFFYLYTFIRVLSWPGMFSPFSPTEKSSPHLPHKTYPDLPSFNCFSLLIPKHLTYVTLHLTQLCTLL